MAAPSVDGTYASTVERSRFPRAAVAAEKVRSSLDDKRPSRLMLIAAASHGRRSRPGADPDVAQLSGKLLWCRETPLPFSSMNALSGGHPARLLAPVGPRSNRRHAISLQSFRGPREHTADRRHVS